MSKNNVLIVAASGTAQYADKVSRALHIPWIQIESASFPNEELKLKVEKAGATTILLGSLSKPVDTRIMEYVLVADALKRLGCRKLIGVLSWYAYSKQDKVFLPGEPLSAKVIADILQNEAFEQLYTLDLHNPAICNYFSIPVTNMSAIRIFVDYFKQTNLSNSLVVCPDTGSVKNSTIVAEALGIPVIHAHKTRDRTTGAVTYTGMDGDVAGKNILIFDDMIATGSTIVEISALLHRQGALNIIVSCTHHLYVKNAQEKLDTSHVSQVIVTNSIKSLTTVHSPKLTVLDISPVIIEHLSQFKNTQVVIK